jgi:hypothetical protein
MVTLQSSILLQQFFLLFSDIGECLSGLFQYIALFLFLFLDIDECLSSLANNCPANNRIDDCNVTMVTSISSQYYQKETKQYYSIIVYS